MKNDNLENIINIENYLITLDKLAKEKKIFHIIIKYVIKLQKTKQTNCVYDFYNSILVDFPEKKLNTLA
jgi:hypothetical protein